MGRVTPARDSAACPGRRRIDALVESNKWTWRLGLHLLIRNAAVLTLLLATQACARGPAADNATQENVMNGQTPTAEAARASRDDAAATADAAAQETSKANPSAMVTPGGYPPLPQGQPVQVETLVDAIVRMAKTFESPEDMLPENVAKFTALGYLEGRPREADRRARNRRLWYLRIRGLEALRAPSWPYDRAQSSA